MQPALRSANKTPPIPSSESVEARIYPKRNRLANGLETVWEIYLPSYNISCMFPKRMFPIGSSDRVERFDPSITHSGPNTEDRLGDRPINVKDCPIFISKQLADKIVELAKHSLKTDHISRELSALAFKCEPLKTKPKEIKD